VVEIKSRDKAVCTTPIGRAIGLEPITVITCNYPAPNTFPDRPNIEGFYLLETLPHIRVCDSSSIPPMPLVAMSAECIKATLKEVSETYHLKKHVVSWWNAWAAKYAPESDDACEYVTKLRLNGIPYRIPICEIFNEDFINKDLVWEHDVITDLYFVIDSTFQWPTSLAAAMPSVVTRFDKNPPLPRHYATDDDYIVDLNSRYSIATDNRYYSSNSMTVDKIKELLSLKVCAWIYESLNATSSF
jgi:hypothetical protein